MPPLRQGNIKTLKSFVTSERFTYKYPKGLNLDPRSDQHKELGVMVMDKASGAYRKMQERHTEWQHIDSVLKAYVPPQDLKNENEDGEFNKIIVPVSRITLETIVTYMMAAFITDPIHKYTGTGPEDAARAIMMTEVNNIHARWFGQALDIHTALRDMFAYGIGGSHAFWEIEKVRGVVFDEESQQRIPGEEVISQEGNSLMAINPYRMILDPNVPAHEIQKGEFFGWVSRTTYPQLRRLELNNPELFFNVQYLQEVEGVSSAFDANPDHLPRVGNVSNERPIDVLWFFLDLLPKEHKLGTKTDPEKWLFAIAGDTIVIAARPMNLFHDKFPGAIGAPDTDGHTAIPGSRLGHVHDLQEHINFLFSSHIANVKRSVNNELIYDPMMINEEDILDPKPGKRIRLRKAAWGRGGIDSYVHQLQVQDLTQSNMLDVAFLRQLVEDASGSSINRAPVNQGPRISSVAAQGDRFNNLSRLEKDAILVSLQYMRPIGRLFAFHTQQFMNQPVFVNTTGDLRSSLKKVFPDKVVPEQLEVGFKSLLGGPLDLLTHDGTIPGREDANAWIQFLQVLGSFPQALQAVSIPRLVQHIARQLGAKSIDQFIDTEVQTLPDEEVLRQVRAGNLVAPQNGNV